MNEYTTTFTVFTPTHQRAHTLHRVYKSLSQQTFRDFEWLIVDDASSDGTDELVKVWQEEADFSIRYFWQEKAGKHMAINHAVPIAKGELFVIADSDDAFTNNALECFARHWRLIPDTSNFTGISCLCQTAEGKVVGDSYPEDVFDSNTEEMFFRYSLKGEKWGFHRTDVMAEFPFPTFDGNYVPESYVWFRIARKYKMRFINEPLRYYFNDSGNQLSYRPVADSVQYRAFYCDTIQFSYSRWFRVAPFKFLKLVTQYLRLTLHSESTLRDAFVQCKPIWLLTLATPLAILVFLQDKVKGR